MKTRLCMIAVAMAITYATWCNCRLDLDQYICWHQRESACRQLDRQIQEIDNRFAADRRAGRTYPPPVPPGLLEQLDQRCRELDFQVEQSGQLDAGKILDERLVP